MRFYANCAAVAVALTAANAHSQAETTLGIIETSELGVVEAPAAGSVQVPLYYVPLAVMHTAQVAFKEFDGAASVTAAQLDKDEVVAIWELSGTANGYGIEADIKQDGVLVELEIEIALDGVPQHVLDAQVQFFPDFVPAGIVEKSIRPTEAGLPEIWYEFSGDAFDVEVRSDGRAVLAEPA